MKSGVWSGFLGAFCFSEILASKAMMADEGGSDDLSVYMTFEFAEYEVTVLRINLEVKRVGKLHWYR